MEIIKAEIDTFDIIKRITQDTINQVYPHYYPAGVVVFFQEHHNDSNILTDIGQGKVFVVQDKDEYIGTVTIDGNEINRLFVLPQFHKNGYGSKMMDFAEKEIFSKYSKIQLHASLPGKKFYIERGYSAVEYRTKKVCCDDWICIDIMEKRAPDVEKKK